MADFAANPKDAKRSFARRGAAEIPSCPRDGAHGLAARTACSRQSPPAATSPEFEGRRLSLSGSPREIGRAHGEELRAEIHDFYALRLKSALAHVEAQTGAPSSERRLLSLAEDCLREVSRAFSEGYAELFGISEGADMPLTRVWLMNALTDIKDLAAAGGGAAQAEGCSSVVLTRAREGRPPIAAQTWDLDPSNQPFVVLVERQPDRGLPTVALTTAGCLSLTGINAAGVAVGTNNIRAKDSRPGVGYLDVLHHMLGQARAREAAQLAEGATRAAAHAYFALDEEQAFSIECTATRAVRAELGAPFVYTNHIQDPGLRELELMGDPGSTYVRAARLSALAEGELGPAELRAALADHEGGEQAICRHGARGVRTNGAVVLEPGQRRLHAIFGPACGDGWITAQLSA